MSAHQYITGSCVISNHVVYKNGEAIFNKPTTDLAGLLLSTYQHFEISYPKFYKMDNLSKLGWLAAEILLKDKQLTDNYNAADIGVVLANANSSLDTDIKYFETAKKEMASPALFVYTLPNIVTGEICIRHKLKGENAFFILDKFDASFIEQYVSNLINNDILQACICGWVEVLGETYKTVLFLIEKNKKDQSVPFTTENITKIYAL